MFGFWGVVLIQESFFRDSGFRAEGSELGVKTLGFWAWDDSLRVSSLGV